MPERAGSGFRCLGFQRLPQPLDVRQEPALATVPLPEPLLLLLDMPVKPAVELVSIDDLKRPHVDPVLPGGDSAKSVMGEGVGEDMRRDAQQGQVIALFR